MPVVVYEFVTDNGMDSSESKVIAVAEHSKTEQVEKKLLAVLEQLGDPYASIHATKLYVNDLTGLLMPQHTWTVSAR